MEQVVGGNIKRERQRRAWTQAQLAEAARITEKTVQRAERGEPLSAESLQSIAWAFDVEVEDLRRSAEAEEAKKIIDRWRRGDVPDLGDGDPARGFAFVDAVQAADDALHAREAAPDDADAALRYLSALADALLRAPVGVARYLRSSPEVLSLVRLLANAVAGPEASRWVNETAHRLAAEERWGESR